MFCAQVGQLLGDMGSEFFQTVRFYGQSDDGRIFEMFGCDHST